MVKFPAEELQRAARHLLQQPLTCAETQPDAFALIRRHEQQLDKLFTQRLGYRLQVTADTARLYKGKVIPHRPILKAPTSSGRPLKQRECVMLSLVLASVAAGQRIISLRDLIDLVRAASVEAEVNISDEPVDRRAFIVALKWMIDAGLMTQLHEQIDRYEHDANADAVLEVNPERVAMLPLPRLTRAENVTDLIGDAQQFEPLRQTLRAFLTENPVLYRSDVTDYEWSELRRRLGDDIAMLDELFGLRLEARAEGIASVDVDGKLTDQAFPTTGTVGHAALLLIEEVSSMPGSACTVEELDACLAKLAEEYQRFWAKRYLEDLKGLRRQVVDLLDCMRLCTLVDDTIQLCPAAARFSTRLQSEEISQDKKERSDKMGSSRSRKRLTKVRPDDTNDTDGSSGQQGSLW